jgi:hypothetical protein
MAATFHYELNDEILEMILDTPGLDPIRLRIVYMYGQGGQKTPWLVVGPSEKKYLDSIGVDIMRYIYLFKN